MEIAGIVRNSFVDYPGVLACAVFAPHCNYNCWYCHNSHLLHKDGSIREEDFFKFLAERKSFLDGVVVSGGEPTLQKDLVEFIKKIKNMGFLVKLDTNGSNFDVLNALISQNLLDYVAMDIKAPFEKYDMIIGYKKDLTDEKKSINLLLQNKVDYEFRTTFSPDLQIDDIEQICKQIKGAKRYSIQKYRRVEYNPKNMQEKSREEMNLAGEVAKKYVEEVKVLGT